MVWGGHLLVATDHGVVLVDPATGAVEKPNIAGTPLSLRFWYRRPWNETLGPIGFDVQGYLTYEKLPPPRSDGELRGCVARRHCPRVRHFDRYANPWGLVG